MFVRGLGRFDQAGTSISIDLEMCANKYAAVMAQLRSGKVHKSSGTPGRN